MESPKLDFMKASNGLLINGKYKVERKLGAGSFGELYLAIDCARTGEKLALKIEGARTRHPQLEYEARVYMALAGGVGIPFVNWYGLFVGEYHVMAMDLLGPSLEDLFNYCQRKFSLKTVLFLADQMIARMEYVHSKHFLHRDIKPDNFLMGLNKKGNLVYAIDYGLAKKYRDPRNMQHISYRDGKSLTGTARYASINTHLGIEQSRRDDMEALGYVFLYFVRGSLPWQGLKGNTKQAKYHAIMEKKMTTSSKELCQGVPREFNMYLDYVKGLGFEEAPDYTMLRQLFRDLFTRMGFVYDYQFDWMIIKKANESVKKVNTIQVPLNSTHREILERDNQFFAPNQRSSDPPQSGSRATNVLRQEIKNTPISGTVHMTYYGQDEAPSPARHTRSKTQDLQDTPVSCAKFQHTSSLRPTQHRDQRWG